jgi:hypothetical protein
MTSQRGNSEACGLSISKVLDPHNSGGATREFLQLHRHLYPSTIVIEISSSTNAFHPIFTIDNSVRPPARPQNPRSVSISISISRSVGGCNDSSQRLDMWLKTAWQKSLVRIIERSLQGLQSIGPVQSHSSTGDEFKLVGFATRPRFAMRNAVLRDSLHRHAGITNQAGIQPPLARE